MTLADPEHLREIARQMQGGVAYLPDYVFEQWGQPVFAAAARIEEQAAEIAYSRSRIGELHDVVTRLRANIAADESQITALHARLFEMQNAAIELTAKLTELEADRAAFRAHFSGDPTHE